MNSLKIGPGTRVTLHFAVKLTDGSVVDSTADKKKPATFTIGDKNLLESFEQLMFGMMAGEKQSFEITPEIGFGQHNPSNIQELPRASFEPGMELSEGLMISFADAAGNEVPGVVKTFDEESVSVDFNHPLAGRDLIFDVDIIDVEPAITH